MLIHVMSLLLFSMIVMTILIDVIPILGDWIGRIHIGRYKDRNHWYESIIDTAFKWLNKTPPIKATDNTRLIVIDKLRGNYTRSSIQYWQEAALLLGLSECLKNIDNKQAQGIISKFLNSKFDNEGQWKEKPNTVDAAMLAYAVMKLETVERDRFKKALDYTWSLIKEHIGEDRTVEYRKFMKNYRYVDTIGLICPFLVCYGVKYNNVECIELAIRQIREYERYGLLNKHYIPCHAYQICSKVPSGLYGWGRGVGWFLIGLTDSWNELDENSNFKDELQVIVKKFANEIINYQQSNGSWSWLITRDECRSDSSATAALAWFFLNASRIDEIAEKCLKSVDEAMKYLMSVTRRNGIIDFSQGDTKDIGVYSSVFNILPFTQGFSIRCMNLYFHNNITFS